MIAHLVRTNLVDIAVANMPADAGNQPVSMLGTLVTVGSQIVTSRSGDARRRGRGGIGVLHGVAGKKARDGFLRAGLAIFAMMTLCR